MKIFVAGGAGFIGSHFIEKIISSTDILELIVYDNFCSGRRNYLSNVMTSSSKIKLVEADIKHLGELTHSMQGSDLVVNFAANADIAKALTQPDIDFWEGTYLTQNILEAMRITKTRQILYMSGSGVYGEALNISFDEDYGPCQPISPYGASKLACEALISAYCHMFGIKGRAFRFANVVGPRQTHGVGYDFIRRLRVNSGVLRILGDGTQCKSYIHVDDVLCAVLLVFAKMQEEEKCFDIYNVATDDYVTVTEIADAACEVSGLDRKAVHYDYTGGDRGWIGDVPKVLFNVEKIKGIGWHAQRTSKEAIIASLVSMLAEITSENG